MVADVKFDISGIDRFQKITLEKAASFALPLAIKNTLNSAAFEAMQKSRKTIGEDFTLRNKFTERSVRVVPEKTLKMATMAAVVGSVAGYMESQELGEKRTSKGKHGLRIPTSAAAGQTGGQRTRPILKKYRRGQLKLANEAGRIRASDKGQFILMSIRVAALRGQSPYVFLPFGGKKAGLYRVIPAGSPPSPRYKRGKKRFSRKFTWGRPKGTPGKERLVLIHSFARRTITIKPTRWLKKNVEKVAGTLQFRFNEEADRVFRKVVK